MKQAYSIQYVDRLQMVRRILRWREYCLSLGMPIYDLKLVAPWVEVKEKLKELHLDLTDADLIYEPGNEQELLERISHKINKDIPATKPWIESVSSNRNIAS